MTDAIVNRGPDDSGSWLAPEAGLALGFRRLSILDLSPEGHQPKASAHGRYIITFNGEIYNYMEIRRVLEEAGFAFRGHSDTEVILAAFEHWGIDDSLRKFNGMFAIAAWDTSTGHLHLARDPLGIKPMYFGRHGGTWLWGSELKALRMHPDFIPTLDPDALALYFRQGYVPGPYSIFKGIQKLQPGHVLTLKGPEGEAVPRPFWTLAEVVAQGKANPFQGTDEEAIQAVGAALKKSVGMQMVSDVPLGAFLSGGIDSSLIATFMQQQSPRPIKTFCIGFADDKFNEAHHALSVAKHLGTDHTEWIISAQDALDLIPELPTIYDEPFADPAAVPTCLVSRLARRTVTVSLSGDGGDENFGGYHFHLSAQEGRLAAAQALPAPLRRAVGAGMSTFSALLRKVPGALAGHGSTALNFRARNYQFRDPLSFYRTNVADEFGRGGTVLLSPRDPAYLLNQPGNIPALDNLAETFMYLDSVMMLPDEFLTKIDRAAMADSLEGRVPFLDVDLVSLAWSLPINMKIRGGVGKWVLRQVLKRHVPAEIVDRPKHGFSVPISSWLKGPLQAWAGDLLSPERIKAQNLLSAPVVTAFWEEHKAGRVDQFSILWRLLMFQAWLAQSNSN